MVVVPDIHTVAEDTARITDSHTVVEVDVTAEDSVRPIIAATISTNPEVTETTVASITIVASTEDSTVAITKVEYAFAPATLDSACDFNPV